MSDERGPDPAPENGAEAGHVEADADVAEFREALDSLRRRSSGRRCSARSGGA
jgi:hypothetical protein